MIQSISSKIKPYLDEKRAFWLFFLIHLIPVWGPSWFYTYDGPAHLHNARQMWEIIFNHNTFLQQYYVLNTLPDNWLVHSILMLLQSITGMMLAEKLLVTGYMILFAWGFRKWMRQLDAPMLSWWVFTFIFFYNFYLGQYSFAFSVALFPWFLWSWQAFATSSNAKKLAISGVFLLLLYLTHIVSFLTAGLVAGLLSLGYPIHHRLKRHNLLAYLGLISLPGLVLSIGFFSQNAPSNMNSWLPLSEKLHWLINFRSLIVFSFAKEEKITLAIAAIFWVWTIWSIYKTRMAQKTQKVWLMCWLACLLLFLTLPDMASGGGFISSRLHILMLLIWAAFLAAMNKDYRKFTKAWGLVLFMNLYLLVFYTKTSIHYGKVMYDFQNTVAQIDPNSIVLSLNYSEDWFLPHLTESVSLNSPALMLNNYEAQNNYFPLRWQDDEVIHRDLQRLKSHLAQPPCGSKAALSAEVFKPDYIIRYAFNPNKDLNCEESMQELLSAYTLVAASIDGRTELFGKKITK
jgi:hypothetical protein